MNDPIPPGNDDAPSGRSRAAPQLVALLPETGSHEARRTRRLRARRVQPEELKLVGLVASGGHPKLGSFSASVEDLSLTGAALVIHDAAESAELVSSGDRVQGLELSCRGVTIHQGDAHVRRRIERGRDLLVGVEVCAGSMDIAELYQLATSQRFSERLQQLLSREEDEISNAFKLWVGDQRSRLEKLKTFLDNEERGLAEADRWTREQALRAYLEDAAPCVAARLNQASKELAQLVSDLPEERQAAHRAYYKSHLLPLLSHSPFLQRAFTKPLGYAGDYEMMNMLYRDHAEGDSLFGRVLNLYAVQEPAAQANINRLEYLSEKIRTEIAARGRLRLASVGCGPAQELAALLERSPSLGPCLDVTLIDQEERVITYCERTLAPLAARTGMRLQLIRESVRRLLAGSQLRQALGERDFIYSAGLFDYLNQRSFSALLGALYSALAPDGQLCVGNVASHNPSRPFMECGLDWFLIHRSQEELLEFARALAPLPQRVRVDAEPSGVNLFLLVWK